MASIEKLPRDCRQRLIHSLYFFLKKESTRLGLRTQTAWSQQWTYLNRRCQDLGIPVTDNGDSRWSWIPPDMHDVDVLIEGCELSTVFIPCHFCNCWRSSPFLCFHVYLGFVDVMSDNEMIFASFSSLDDFDDGPRTISTDVSFGENVRKLMVDHFYQH